MIDAEAAREIVRQALRGAEVRGGVRCVLVGETLDGMVMIRYDGGEPATAIAAGLRGNQNDGWSALVSPDEVENVRVETTRLPRVRE